MSNLKRFLALTLAMLMVVGAMAVSAKTFSDVAESAPYAEAVDVLSELGVILGTGADEFSPDALVERQQMAMFIARLATAKPAWFAVEAAAVFADQKDPVYNAAVAYAVTNGIILGRTATEFDGAATVTLQEAATMLCRALGYYSNAMNAAYPMSYLMMADEVGLLTGLDDVAPTAALTRGEVAIMLYNAFDAKMASVDMVYGPNGVDRIVEIPTDAAAKYLSTSKWDCKVIDGAAITATTDFTLGAAGVSASKSIADPVRITSAGPVPLNKIVSFASIAKFLADGATTADMLGVELKVITRNDNILKIDVVGSKSVTKSASYDAATTKLTVNGVVYNIATANLSLAYPVDGDNCFYKYVGSDIQRIVDIYPEIAQVNTGFFLMEVINEGRNSQMIIFKPLSLAAVTADAEGKLKVADALITDNKAAAVKDDYVTYYKNSTGTINEVYDVATLTTNDKIIKLNAGDTATLASGIVVPSVTTANPIPGSSFVALNTTSISNSVSLNVYKVNGVIVRTETYSATPVIPGYAPNSYYKILAVANRGLVSTDPFTGAKTYYYMIQVLNDAGTVSNLIITHINDEELASVAQVDVVEANDLTVDSWDLSASKALLAGKYITVVGQKIYTALNITNYRGTDEEKAPTGITKLSTNVYTVAGVGTAMTTSYTKMIIKGTDATYRTFSGTAFTALGNGVTLSNGYAIVHDNGGIKEIVYFYAEANVAAAHILGTPVAPVVTDVYLFNNYVSIAATSITYNVLNIKTGVTSEITFNNAADNATVPTEVTSGAASPLYVAGANAPALYTPSGDDTSTIVTGSVTIHSSGVILSGSNVYTTTETKFYKFDAGKFVETTAAAIGTAAFNATIVVNSNNVTYVIVR